MRSRKRLSRVIRSLWEPARDSAKQREGGRWRRLLKFMARLREIAARSERAAASLSSARGRDGWPPYTGVRDITFLSAAIPKKRVSRKRRRRRRRRRGDTLPFVVGPCPRRSHIASSLSSADNISAAALALLREFRKRAQDASGRQFE